MTKCMLRRTAALTVIASASLASADVVFSEILGSTAGEDIEFIELVNKGDEAVDISGWSIEFWDSNIDKPEDFGGADPTKGRAPFQSPYAVQFGAVLEPGEVFTLGNILASQAYGSEGLDGLIGRNGIDNESYTVLLVDAQDQVRQSILFIDAAVDRFGANRDGVPLVADLTVQPALLSVASGIYLNAQGEYGQLSPQIPSVDGLEGGTPGVNQTRPACTADANADGDANVQDLLVYLRDFREGEGDVDDDGLTTAADLLLFLSAFRGGC